MNDSPQPPDTKYGKPNTHEEPFVFQAQQYLIHSLEGDNTLPDIDVILYWRKVKEKGKQ